MKERTYFCHKLFTPRELLSPAVMGVADGAVTDLGPVAEAPKGAIPLEGTVAPGLVDLQVNGFGTHHVLDAGPRDIEALARALPAAGVTAFLPTVLSCSEERRLAALDAVAAAESGGARILGVHLEGPWLSPERAGAHDRRELALPAPEAVERSLGRHPGLVRMVTIAPELDGAFEAIRRICASGAVASLGHTDAGIDPATAAVDTGARMVTHIFNAMRPLHHRDPGVIAAALIDERVVTGVIADGVHLHPATIALVFRAKGASGVALVSDTVAVRGPDVDTSRGAVSLPDGTLAGAVVGLAEGVRTAVRAGVSLRDAVTAATRTPAGVLKTPYGRLEPGAPADFVVLADDLRPLETYVGGERVWSAR